MSNGFIVIASVPAFIILILCVVAIVKSISDIVNLINNK